MTALPVLTGDCAACVGLCCVALPFAKSAAFPVDKPAGRACSHLASDYRCDIHERLRDEGYRGCTSYDCFGAGQRVTAAYGSATWRDDAATAKRMFADFTSTRQLHEMLVYLHEATSLVEDEPLRTELRDAIVHIDGLCDAGDEAVVDVGELRARIGALLSSVSELARRGGAPPVDRRIRRGADLIAADLRAVELRGADLRGALLIRADLRNVDMCRTDLLGADLRDADLRGANLSQALFATGPQLAAARGDAATTLPPAIPRPPHWLTER